MALIGMTLLAAACSFLPGRQFVFGFPADGNIAEVHGVLTDTTGSVVRVTTVQGVDHPMEMDRGMLTFAEDPTSVLVFWLGTECDETADIKVTPEGGTTIEVRSTFAEGGCFGGVGRYVRIWFAGPVDLSRTSVAFPD
jgi:hypothetical protein